MQYLDRKGRNEADWELYLMCSQAFPVPNLKKAAFSQNTWD